jgi:serine/threonine protein kinase
LQPAFRHDAANPALSELTFSASRKLMPNWRAEVAFGRYRHVELMGRGGMGEVWRAFDTSTNRVVAVKLQPVVGQ